jgi:hypothetical protein
MHYVQLSQIVHVNNYFQSCTCNNRCVFDTKRVLNLGYITPRGALLSLRTFARKTNICFNLTFSHTNKVFSSFLFLRFKRIWQLSSWRMTIITCWYLSFISFIYLLFYSFLDCRCYCEGCLLLFFWKTLIKQKINPEIIERVREYAAANNAHIRSPTRRRKYWNNK